MPGQFLMLLERKAIRKNTENAEIRGENARCLAEKPSECDKIDMGVESSV